MPNQFDNGSLAKILTKEFLIKEYAENKRSVWDISIEVGCSNVTVWNYLRKYEIPLRKYAEERKPFNGLNPARKILTEKYLRKEYLVCNRSMTNIAKEVGCAPSLVKDMLLKYNIPLHNTQNAFSELGDVLGIQEDNDYLVILAPYHHLANKRGYVRLHLMLAEYYFNHYLQENEVVHHKNGNKQCNEQWNLQIMTKREHDRLETKKRWDEGTFIRKPKVKKVCRPNRNKTVRSKG